MRTDYTQEEAAVAVDTVRALERMCGELGVTVHFRRIGEGSNPDAKFLVAMSTTTVTAFGQDPLDALQALADNYVKEFAYNGSPHVEPRRSRGRG